MVKEHIRKLGAIERRLLQTPDQQISLTDPDARSMATSGRGTGIVGYNVQTAVDTEHHMIVAHEVTNVGHDRGAADGDGEVGTRGHGPGGADRAGRSWLFQRRGDSAVRRGRDHSPGSQATDLEQHADGRFDKRDFIYIAKRDEYRCPAGERAIWRFTTVENGLTIHKYWPSACPHCSIEVAVHDQRLPTNHALGTRAGARRHAAASGSHARSLATAPADCRASLRYAEGLDGFDPFPHEDLADGSEPR